MLRSSRGPMDVVQEFPEKYDTYIEQGPVGTNVSGGQRQSPVLRPVRS